MILRIPLAIWLFVMAPLLGQGMPQAPIEQIAKLARERTKALVETFDKESFKPDTVFRGKTLLQWLDALRDADIEGTAGPAKKVWLAMGPKAVPFLVTAQSVVDWQEIDCSLTPRSVCRAMGEKAIEPLVRLLGSDHTFYAWVILDDIISDSGGTTDRFYRQEAGLPPPSKEAQKAIDIRLGRITKALESCLGSSDAATRLAGLLLLRSVAMGGLSSEAWGAIPVGARRLLDKDPHNEVRGAACELLVWLGVKEVKGGLCHDELKRMAHPNGNVNEVDRTLPPEVALSVVMGIFLHAQREMEKPAAPAGK